MSILSAFNNVITNFIDDCILVFPEDKDFKVYKKGVQLLVKVNPKKVLTVFTEYTNIYREQILIKNEDFFLKNDYTDVVSTSNKYSDSEIFNNFKNIKGYWLELEDSNKTKIWDYMLLLITISDKYYDA